MKFSDFYEKTRIVNNVDEWQKQYVCEVDTHHEMALRVMHSINKARGTICHYNENTREIDVDGSLLIDEDWIVNGRLIVKFGHVLKSVHCMDVTDLLTTLDGMPHTVDGDFRCNNMKKLKSAEGGPSYVGGTCSYTMNGFTTLDGLPAHIGHSLYLEDNPIKSLHNIHKQIRQIGGMLILCDKWKCDVKESVLGLLMIHGITGVDFDSSTGEIFYDKPTDWQAIINKHLSKSGNSADNIYDCQMDLVNAGYEDLAKL